MQPFTLRCPRPGAAALSSTFFILSRGHNAGRPSYSPNPNCFALSCEVPDLARYYWLVYALWMTGSFGPCIMGTAIPFVRLRDVQACICAHRLADPTPGPLIGQLAALSALEAKLTAQMALLSECRKALLHKAILPNPAASNGDLPQFIFSPINMQEQ